MVNDKRVLPFTLPVDPPAIPIPFLPAEHIADMFSHLKSKAGSDQLRQLVSYVEKTYGSLACGNQLIAVSSNNQ